MSKIETLYKFKISLEAIEPQIWRRFIVSPQTTLPELHDILQIVMGWTDSHLHSFHIDGKEYGEPDPEYEMMDGPTMIDYRKIKLSKIIKDGISSFKYLYDFGDSWMHTITLEKQFKDEDDLYAPPLCIGGERACPPEDVGSYPGYMNFAEAISDPNHEGHVDMLSWVGGHYDAEAFSSNQVNRELMLEELRG